MLWLLKRISNLRDDELVAGSLSCAYFFVLFCGYYILRPLREEMGLAGGVDNLPKLFLFTLAATLVATPLFGALVSRFSRRVFIPIVYRFFALNLLAFFAVLTLIEHGALPATWEVWAGRVFYVWLSVFNLFAFSVFWAYMADFYRYPASKRIFGFIAMGGSLGGVVGGFLASSLVERMGRINLMLISIVLLEVAVHLAGALGRWFDRKKAQMVAEGSVPAVRREPEAAPRRRLGGAFSGVWHTLKSPYLIGISAYLFCYSLSSTFVYFEQAKIVDFALHSREAKVALFARIDLWVNILTLVCQLSLSGRIISRFGVATVLALLPVITAMGFIALGRSSLIGAPVLTVLVAFQVLRRATNYALTKPARESLFTVVSHEDKYKAKSFIDTFVYRGGDALGAGIFKWILEYGEAAALRSVAILGVPLAIAWAGLGLYLGLRQKRKAKESGNVGSSTFLVGDSS